MQRISRNASHVLVKDEAPRVIINLGGTRATPSRQDSMKKNLNAMLVQLKRCSSTKGVHHERLEKTKTPVSTKSTVLTAIDQKDKEIIRLRELNQQLNAKLVYIKQQINANQAAKSNRSGEAGSFTSRYASERVPTKEDEPGPLTARKPSSKIGKTESVTNLTKIQKTPNRVPRQTWKTPTIVQSENNPGCANRPKPRMTLAVDKIKDSQAKEEGECEEIEEVVKPAPLTERLGNRMGEYKGILDDYKQKLSTLVKATQSISREIQQFKCFV